MTLSLGASVIVPRLNTMSSGDSISAAKSTVRNVCSSDSMGKADGVNTPSVHIVTSIGSHLNSTRIASAMGIDSAEHPTNRAGREFTGSTNLFRCLRRWANSRATLRHRREWDSARAENDLSDRRAMTTPSSATTVAERTWLGSTSAISPTCCPAVLIAISRPSTRIETTPAKTKQRSLSVPDSCITTAPGSKFSTSTDSAINSAKAASSPMMLWILSASISRGRPSGSLNLSSILDHPRSSVYSQCINALSARATPVTGRHVDQVTGGSGLYCGWLLSLSLEDSIESVVLASAS